MIWAEKVPMYKVLSRDCRSDKTFEFVGYPRRHFYGHSPSFILLRLNKKTKQLDYDRTISISILETGMIRTSTSTYELQEEENDSKAD